MTDAAPTPQASPAPTNPEELQARFGELYQLVAQNPNDPDLRVKLGYIAIDLGRKNEAIANFVRALQLDPTLAFLRARLQSLCTPDELKTFRVPEDVTPFWKDLPGLFAYPLRGNGLGILIVGTIVFAGTTFVAKYGWLWGWLVGAMATGYLSAYYMNVVKTSGVGQKNPPDWPDMSHPTDMVGYFMQWSLAGAASFFPCILTVVFLWDKVPQPVLYVFLGMGALLGLFMYPMSILVTCLYGVGTAFNYAFVVRSIMRIMGEYVMAWVCMLVLGIVVVLLVVLGSLLGVGTVFAGTVVGGELVGALLILLVYELIAMGVSLYGYMVFCRLLGQVYYFAQKKLGWFEG